MKKLIALAFVLSATSAFAETPMVKEEVIGGVTAVKRTYAVDFESCKNNLQGSSMTSVYASYLCYVTVTKPVMTDELKQNVEFEYKTDACNVHFGTTKSGYVFNIANVSFTPTRILSKEEAIGCLNLAVSSMTSRNFVAEATVFTIKPATSTSAGSVSNQ